MKRIYLPMECCRDIRYILLRQLPGYVVVNTLAKEGKVEGLLAMKDPLPAKVLSRLQAAYTRQQKEGPCPPASVAQPTT